MSEGLEARKAELFATITLRNATSRQIYELQAAGAPPADLAPLYERQNQLDADKERLTLEVYNEALYKNLGNVLTTLQSVQDELHAYVETMNAQILQGRLNAERRGQLTSVVEEVEDNLPILRALPGWKVRDGG